MSTIESVKEFLESIPQFICKLDSDNDYLKAYGVKKGIHKSLNYYEIKPTEVGDGFIVSGKLAVSLSVLLTHPSWLEFRKYNSDLSYHASYGPFLKDNPHLGGEFNLEEFLDKFNDFYSEFLLNAGISEDSIILEGNTIRIKGVTVTPIVMEVSSEKVSDTDEKFDGVTEKESSDEDVVEEETTEEDKDIEDAEPVASESDDENIDD